jgi:transposase
MRHAPSRAIQQLNQRLYRAYLLSQQLRQIYRVPAEHALVLLEAWLKWARRSRLKPVVKVARRITEQHQRVEAAITNKLPNAAVEQVNTQIRLITRRRFGYHSPGPSSPSRCSHSADSAHPSPAGATTHGSCRRFPKGRWTRV